MIGLRKFRLVSADARGGGMRDESQKVSAWEAICNALNPKQLGEKKVNLSCFHFKYTFISAINEQLYKKILRLMNPPDCRLE